jgi:hypothetical protein
VTVRGAELIFTTLGNEEVKAAMRFLILAIDHGWQYVPYDLETPEIAAAKTRLETVLTQEIGGRRVDLICEESDPCRLSIAQKMAYEHNPRIPWKNINMSAQERLEAGIREALLHRPYHTIEQPPGSGFYRTVHHRIAEDDTREQFFGRECLQAANACGARSILILCGDMHADFLKQILEASQHQAETNHDLIPEKYWQ